MAALNILYLGPAAGTSLHRAEALKRLGHKVEFLDPRPPVLAHRIGYAWSNTTGAFGTATLVGKYLDGLLGRRTFDLIFVDGGELLGPDIVRRLKSFATWVVAFNLDNPFVARDGRKWRVFLSALPLYDLFVTPRTSSVRRALEAGARDVLHLPFQADEFVHKPPAHPRPAADRPLDVVFVGTWMPERGPLIVALLERGVPVRVFGPRWRKAPEIGAISRVTTEGWVGDAEYVSLIGSAKIGLAMLSIGNEDLHTTRSVEIPAMGTALCGPRTEDHLAMYVDGEEAVFWDDVDECAELCLRLIADPGRLDRIAGAGRDRMRRNGSFNEPSLTRIIDRIVGTRSAAA